MGKVLMYASLRRTNRSAISERHCERERGNPEQFLWKTKFCTSKNLLTHTIVFALFFAVSAFTATWNGLANTGWYNETDSKFTITTAEQLAGLAQLVNAGNDFSGKKIVLASDVTINDATAKGGYENWEKTKPAREWISIGTYANLFSGIFDGQGHVIYGVYGDSPFGYAKNAVIKNMGVSGSYIKSACDGNNNSNCGIGGLVGTIENVSISETFFSGIVKGEGDVGGLVGGIVEDENAISNSYSKGDVYGEYSFGGFIGAIYSAAEQSIYNNFSQSEVHSEKENEGFGFIGFAQYVQNLKNCYYDFTNNNNDGYNSEKDVVAGILGISLSAMTEESSFTGFDFTNIWKMGTNNPELQFIPDSCSVNIADLNVGGTFDPAPQCNRRDVSGVEYTYTGLGKTIYQPSENKPNFVGKFELKAVFPAKDTYDSLTVLDTFNIKRVK